MEHIALLVVIIAVVAVGVMIVMRRTSKADPVDQNPMRGTTRHGSR